MAKKLKWTAVDTIIVIIAAAALAAAYMFFGKNLTIGERSVIQAEIMIANQDEALAEAMTIGDNVTLSLTEKDSGVLKELRTEPALTMTYNSIDGEYINTELPGKVDIYATVEVNAEVTDYAFSVGSTAIKVGMPIPFRGKGYAAQGYVININE